MNDEPNTNEAPEEAEGVTAFTLEDVDKRYFSPDELTAAQEYLDKVMSIPDVAVKRNFKQDEDFPDGFGLSILPISKRTEEKGNVTIGVAVAAIPDPALIADHEKGSQFIREVVLNSFMAKVSNSVRPRADGSTAGSIPASVEDFIESRKRGEGLKTFTEIAPHFVKALRAKGIKFMTSGILRQTLQSKAFAESQFSKIGQNQWESVINTMIAYANKNDLDPAILQSWLDTREQAETLDLDNLDFSDLDSME